MQTDPIGTADYLNLYAYVGNDPINANDPEGLAANWLKGATLAGGNAVDTLLFGGYAQNASQSFGAGNIGEGVLNFGAGLAFGAMNLATGWARDVDIRRRKNHDRRSRRTLR